MNEYWISWTSCFDVDGGFELHSPWWISGWSYNEKDQEESVFVGAIRADSEDEAFAKISAAYDAVPDGGVSRRFIEIFEKDEKKPWEREGGRFQLGDWMEW